MQTTKGQRAEAVERAGHLSERGLIAAFLRDAATEFSTNPFPRTSAATVGHVGGAQAFEFRCLGIAAAGLPCLLAAVSALDRSEPFVRGRLARRLVMVKAGNGTPGFPYRTAPTTPAQLDLFAWAS